MSPKLIILFLLVAAAAYLFQHPFQHAQVRPVGYAEGRVKLHYQHLDYEAVLIAERTREECEDGYLKEIIEGICTKGNECTGYSFECKPTISEKYLSMLNKEPAKTHFIHLVRPEDKAQGVVLIWGLSESDSMKWCEVTKAYLETRRPGSRKQCI